MVIVFIILFTQWLGPQRLTDEPGRSETTWPSNAHCITCNGKGMVYVVYTRDAWTDTSEIYIKMSTDYGTTWLPEQRITDAINERTYPSVALDTLNRVHVVWMDMRDGVGWQVYCKRSTDGGLTWGNDIRISLDDDYSQSPSVATDGANEVYVVWFDSVDFWDHDIYFRKSNDGGVNWGSEIRISTGQSVEDYPTIAYEPLDKIHIAWPDYRNDVQYDIYYRRSTDRGNTWGPQTNLTPDTFGQVECSIAASSSHLHLAWCDARNSQPLEPDVEVYYKNSTNSGSSWNADTRLTNTDIEPHWPNIAADAFGGAHIVYQGGTEIYYLSSVDNGAMWSDTVNISNDSAVSMHPFVATDSFVHVVWSDDRDGNFEIYYNRTTQPLVGARENAGQWLKVENAGLMISPNPARSVVRIAYGVERNTEGIGRMAQGIELKILDVSGRLVKSFNQLTRYHLLNNQFTWAGTDEIGKKVAAGIYFVQLRAGDLKQTEKVILLR